MQTSSPTHDDSSGASPERQHRLVTAPVAGVSDGIGDDAARLVAFLSLSGTEDVGHHRRLARSASAYAAVMWAHGIST